MNVDGCKTYSQRKCPKTTVLQSQGIELDHQVE